MTGSPFETEVGVPHRLASALRDVAGYASTPRARSSAAGDELGVSFDSDDRSAMVATAGLFLARVAYLDESRPSARRGMPDDHPTLTQDDSPRRARGAVWHVAIDPPPPARGFALIAEVVAPSQAPGTAQALAESIARDHPDADVSVVNPDDPSDRGSVIRSGGD